MLEIPGEEAPTDPGKVARLRAEAEAQKQRKASQKRNALLGALSLVVLSGVGAAGFWQYQKQQEALVMEFEEFYQVPLDEIASAPKPDPAVAASPTGKPAAGKPRATPSSGTGSPGVARGSDAPTGDAPAMKGAIGSAPSGDALPDGIAKATAAPATGGFGSSNIGVERLGLGDKVLTDEGEIYEMAKRVIAASSPQMQTCYNQRLKQAEGLAGAWKLAFTIDRTGATKNVGVNGVNVQDAELEACMVRAVQGWKFQRIGKDQPITKSYRFGASSW
jgi:hypothetical protein